MLDVSRNRRLSFESIRTACELASITIHESDIRHWISAVDLDGKGHVTFADYLRIYFYPRATTEFVNPTEGQPQRLRILRSVFDKYDKDRDGYISLSDLKSVLGPADGKAMADSWISNVASHGDGKVSFAAFAKYFW